MSRHITFGKFQGTLEDGRDKLFFVDGIKAGTIECSIVGGGLYEHCRVGGYIVNVFGEDHPLNGLEFDTLGEAQTAIRSAFTTKEVR